MTIKSIKSSFKNFEEKKTFLDDLFYNVGKQGNDFELCFMDEKTDKKSKWRKYSVIGFDVEDKENKKWIEISNNRTILKNEIVLDLEEPERYEEVVAALKKEGIYYRAFKTGSKGFHFHLIYNRELTSDEKLDIIKKYKCDTQKASDRCMIALEFVPHWKTGKNKELTLEHKGINHAAAEKKDKLKAFLLEDRQKYASLGCGHHNGVYYFGTKLFRDGTPYTAVTTSDKKVYINLENNQEIRTIFGLNYKDDFYDEGIDNILSREAVDKWIYGNTDDITLESVYKKLVDLFKKYIYFEDKRKYSLLACYRIAGFFMAIWRARARLFEHGEVGSAKSRLTNINHNTGFNSVALGDWTIAYLQRLIESTRGETHIDDFETLDEDKKQATTRLVKTGFMKGFKAGKISEGKNRRPETYDLFNTTTLNNTEGLDFISTDRCITIRIPKIAKKEYDKEPNFDDFIWKELRDELYILGLKYPEQIKKIYDGISSDRIRGRLFLIIKPELTIAKLISSKLSEELEEFWIEEIEQRDTIDYETDWGFLALKKIYELDTEDYFVLLDDVVQPVGTDLYDGEDFKKKKRSMTTTVGNVLSRNPIFKKRLVKGRTQYKVNRKEFISLLEAKRFLKPIMDIVGSTTSTTSITPTTSTTSTTSTLKEVEQVEPVEDVESERGIDFSKSGIKEELENE